MSGEIDSISLYVSVFGKPPCFTRIQHDWKHDVNFRTLRQLACAVFGDYKRQTPLLRFVVDLLYRRIGPTRRRACCVDHKSRRRRRSRDLWTTQANYTKTEACKLYSRVFWIFLPNVIKIEPYNLELYGTVSKFTRFLRHSVIFQLLPLCSSLPRYYRSPMKKNLRSWFSTRNTTKEFPSRSLNKQSPNCWKGDIRMTWISDSLRLEPITDGLGRWSRWAELWAEHDCVLWNSRSCSMCSICITSYLESTSWFVSSAASSSVFSWFVTLYVY